VSATFYAAALRARRGGREQAALELAEQAVADDPLPELRARIQRLRARIEIWRDAPLRVHELLLTEAASVEEASPGLAVEMLVDAGRAAMMAGQFELGAAALAGARALAQRTLPGIPLLIDGFEMVHRGGSPERERVLRARLSSSEAAEPDGLDSLYDSGVLLYWLEDYAGARRLLEHVVERARGVERHPVLAVTLDTLAALEFRTGQWAAADAHSAEALRIAREFGQTWQIASCLTTLARVAAARGREEACRRLLAEAEELLPPDHLVGAYAASAAALLELGLDRPEEAASLLEPFRSGGTELGSVPTVVPWQSDYVEAQIRAGESEEASAAMRAFAEHAARSGRRSARAAVERCFGLLARSPASVAHFEAALELHDTTPTPFDRARTQLCYGESLRRSHRLGASVPHLRAALGLFEELGAVPWAARARRELDSRRRTAPVPAAARDPLLELTAHELQVALLVGQGSTNREVASALFVSPKTIEYHLTNIYRKLDVRSRTELAGIVSRLERPV
jgi:ATP/maltotriose-dependent transcriptional regulator MalT